MGSDLFETLSFGFVLCFCLCFCCAPAFAADTETGETEPIASVVNVYNENPVNVFTYTGSYQMPFSSSDGLKGVLVSFLGEWESVVVQHSYVDENGNTVVQTDVLPDYPWIASAVLLCLMVFCLFRVGGALICKA